MDVDVALEGDEGWRHGAKYHPIFLLPTDSYAALAISILDAAGAPLRGAAA